MLSRAWRIPARVLLCPSSRPLHGALCIQIERVCALRAYEKFTYWIVIALTVTARPRWVPGRFLLPLPTRRTARRLAAVWNARTLRMVVLGFVGFLGLTIISFVRSAGSCTGSTDLLGAMGDDFSTQGLGRTLENFFL